MGVGSQIQREDKHHVTSQVLGPQQELVWTISYRTAELGCLDGTSQDYSEAASFIMLEMYSLPGLILSTSRALFVKGSVCVHVLSRFPIALLRATIGEKSHSNTTPTEGRDHGPKNRKEMGRIYGLVIVDNLHGG